MNTERRRGFDASAPLADVSPDLVETILVLPIAAAAAGLLYQIGSAIWSAVQWMFA